MKKKKLIDVYQDENKEKKNKISKENGKDKFGNSDKGTKVKKRKMNILKNKRKLILKIPPRPIFSTKKVTSPKKSNHL